MVKERSRKEDLVISDFGKGSLFESKSKVKIQKSKMPLPVSETLLMAGRKLGPPRRGKRKGAKNTILLVTFPNVHVSGRWPLFFDVAGVFG